MKAKYSRYSILFFIVLFTFLAVAVTADFLLQRRITTIQQRLLGIISERSSAVVSYQELNVAGIGISIDELTLSDITDPERELIRIGNVQLKFSLRDLFSTHSDVSLERVNISSLYASLDTEKDQDFINTLLDIFRPEAKGPEAKEDSADMRLQLENINLHITSGSGSLELQRLTLNAEIAPDILQVSGNASAILEYQNQRLLSNLRVASNTTSGVSKAELVFFDIRYGDIFLLTQQYSISLSDKAIELHTSDDTGVILNFSLDRSTNDWQGDIVLDEFIPRSLILVSNSDWYIDSFLDSSITGSIQLSSRNNELSHRMQLAYKDFALLNIGSANIDIMTSGTPASIDIEDISITVPEDKARVAFTGELSGPRLLPTGTLSVENLMLGNTRVNTVSEIKAEGDIVQIRGRNTRWGKLSIPLLYAELGVQEDNTINGFTRISLNSYTSEQLHAQFTLYNEERSGEILLSLNKLPIMPLANVLDTVLESSSSSLSFLSDTTLSSNSISIKYSDEFLLLNSSKLELFQGDTSLASLDVFLSNNSMVVNARSNTFPWLDLALQNMEISWQNDELTLNTKVMLNQARYDLRVNYLFSGELVAQMYSGAEQVLNFQLFTEDKENRILSAEAENFPINDFFVSFRLDGMLLRQQFASTLYYFRAHNAQGRTLLSFDAVLNGKSATFNNINYLYRNLVLRGSATMNLDDKDIILATLQVPNTKEIYDIALYKEENISLAITAYGVPGNRLGLPKESTLKSFLLIENIFLQPVFFLSFDYKYAIGNTPLQVTAELDGNTDAIRLSELSATYQNFELSVLDLVLDLRNKTVGGTLNVLENGELNRGVNIWGSIDNFKPLESILNVTNLKDSLLDISLLINEKTGRAEFYNITRDPSFLRVRSMSNNKFQLLLRSDNQLRIMINTDDISIDARGSIGNVLSLQLGIKKLDLRMFTPISFDDVFIFDSGVVRGNLSLTGTMQNPSINGRFAIVQSYATTVFSTAQLGPATLEFSVKDNIIYMLESIVPVANGDGSVAMEIYLDKDNKVRWTLDIVSSRGAGLYIYYNFGPVLADGYAKGHIRIEQKSDDITTVTGNITTENATYSLVSAKDMKANENEIEDMQVDLKITSGQNVRFLWPMSTAPLFKASIRPNDTLQIFLDPINNVNYIVGEPAFLAGDIFYFSRNFYVKSGSLNFNKNRFTLAPRLTIQAEMQVYGVDGPIRIFLEAVNQDFETLTPNIYSIPPLPQNELVGLLGESFVSINSNNQVQSLSNLLIYSTDIFTQFNIFNTLEGIIQETFKLDFFSLRTPVIQNILSAVISQSASAGAIQISPYSYLANTALTLGKNIGDSVFAEFNMRFAESSDDIYLGLPLEFQTELKMNIDTPFLNLEWTFNPQNFWDPTLMDTSIGVYWSFQD